MWFLDLTPTIFNKEKATGRLYQSVSLSGFAQMIDPVHLSERAKPYEPLPHYPMTFLNPDRGSLFNGMFININGDTDRDYRRLSRSCQLLASSKYYIPPGTCRYRRSDQYSRQDTLPPIKWFLLISEPPVGNPTERFYPQELFKPMKNSIPSARTFSLPSR